MKLVEQDDADIAQVAVILKPSEEDTFGDETNARAKARLVIEPNLIANLRSESDFTFPRYAGCDRSRCDPSRL